MYLFLFPFFSISGISVPRVRWRVHMHVMASTLAHPKILKLLFKILDWNIIVFRHFGFKAIVFSKHFGFEPRLLFRIFWFEAVLLFKHFGWEPHKSKTFFKHFRLNDFIQFCVSMQHYIVQTYLKQHFWETFEFDATRFDRRIESNTSFRNFVLVERQFKKPFVSKQDFSWISLD